MVERRKYRAGILSEEYELLYAEIKARLAETESLDNMILDLLLRDEML